MSGCFDLLQIAGKALSGYPHSKSNPKVIPPSLKSIMLVMPNDDARAKFKRFTTELIAAKNSAIPFVGIGTSLFRDYCIVMIALIENMIRKLSILIIINY